MTCNNRLAASSFSFRVSSLPESLRRLPTSSAVDGILLHNNTRSAFPLQQGQHHSDGSHDDDTLNTNSDNYEQDASLRRTLHVLECALSIVNDDENDHNGVNDESVRGLRRQSREIKAMSMATNRKRKWQFEEERQ